MTFLDFCQNIGVHLFDWQREAYGAATRGQYRLAGISVPRGNGKSYADAAVGQHTAKIHIRTKFGNVTKDTYQELALTIEKVDK